MPFYRTCISTAFGNFALEGNEVGLTRVSFPPASEKQKSTPDVSANLKRAANQIQSYFSGKAFDFINLEYDFSEMTDFEEKILRTLLKNPIQLLSYAELAEKSGFPRSSRAVGNTMNKNPFPILIPCHRVIRSNGVLGQYAFGITWKKRLLAHEKVFGL